MIEKFKLRKLIEDALREDIGSGDVTTLAIVDNDRVGIARAIAKADTVVAGMEVFREVFHVYNSDISFKTGFKDGLLAEKGEIVAEISGAMRDILTAERVALNIFQRMCGIATLTGRYVDAVKGTKERIMDTRKTTPGLRDLE
ncbi:MAG: nicotinate-nucleotide diphosphorylase (carboxylating), partial [Syntrophaceae bacterium]|nr:nicotinate-nucleotide diphosphorylase (carboxylating) [Syntrophaceae bacterium]